jgi:hypothetical protein
VPSICFDTMPSALSRQALGEDSRSNFRDVLVDQDCTLASAATSNKNCGDEERLLYGAVEKPTDKKSLGWPPSGIQWREVQMSAMPRPMQSECLDEDSVSLKASAEVPAIRLADLTNDQFPSWRPSLSDLDPLGRLGRLEPLAFVRYLITFSIGVAVALAWQSYGNATREGASFKAITLDHDAVRQSLDRVTTSVTTRSCGQT